jgi:hypothetical protein
MTARRRPVFMAELSKYDLRAAGKMLDGQPSRQVPNVLLDARGELESYIRAARVAPE